MIDIERELDIPGLRAAFLPYTVEAFDRIPRKSGARILDIGCGSGTSMLELSRRCDAKFVGIDIDRAALQLLRSEIEKRQLSDRIEVVESSFLEAELPEQSFDLLWEEGAVHMMSAGPALTQCRHLLKPSGFLVMAETRAWFATTELQLREHRFELVDRVLWPDSCWWTDYYAPLEKRVQQIRQRRGDAETLAALARFEREIAMVKKNVAETDCGHFIVQKRP
jgi:ubiquinone/menaquinone biosynthesis C-methylase UbiE